jgi:hypothetical protein
VVEVVVAVALLLARGVLAAVAVVLRREMAVKPQVPLVKEMTAVLVEPLRHTRPLRLVAVEAVEARVPLGLTSRGTQVRPAVTVVLAPRATASQRQPRLMRAAGVALVRVWRLREQDRRAKVVQESVAVACLVVALTTTRLVLFPILAQVVVVVAMTAALRVAQRAVLVLRALF